MNTSSDCGLADTALPLIKLDALTSGRDFLPLLLDMLAHGVLVLDVQGRVLHANTLARAELARQQVLGLVDSELRALTPNDGKTLAQALAKAVAGQASLIHLFGVDTGLSVAVFLLPPSATQTKDRIALFFSRADLCEARMHALYARSCGLTETEELVLKILSRGLSTPEIAAQMKVAVSTVRSHVRSLCAKTGSSGVRELVSQLAVLPPVTASHPVSFH